MQPAPIILFVYNRPLHTQRTLEALAANQYASASKLYVFADGPGDSVSGSARQQVEAVRDYIKNQRLFTNIEISESDRNKGLAASIIAGVTEVLSKHDNAIILEDDMITSPFFLTYMNEALQQFETQEEVISIHGYCVPINYDRPAFFLKGADCWGWATWKRGWNLFNPDGMAMRKEIIDRNLKYSFDFYGAYPYFDMLEKQIGNEIDSWAILWYAAAFLKNKLTLYPSVSLVENIGYDGSGTHAQEKLSSQLRFQYISLAGIPVEEDLKAKEKISDFYFRRSGLRNKLRKIFKIGY